jgi:hypothetical protein
MPDCRSAMTPPFWRITLSTARYADADARFSAARNYIRTSMVYTTKGRAIVVARVESRCTESSRTARID